MFSDSCGRGEPKSRVAGITTDITQSAVRARKLIKQRKPLLLLLAVLLLLCVGHYVGLSDPPASSLVTAPSIVPFQGPRPIVPSPADAPRQTDASQVREAGEGARAGVAASATRYTPAHIELSTCEVVGLEQPCELVVRMSPPYNIGRLAFTVSVDPQMLRILSVRGGDSSSVEAPASLITEERPATGQTTIRMDLTNTRPENGDGSIAVVQFEALEPGTATIAISDLAISNRAGATIPYVASSLTAQAEVMSGPH